MRRRLACLVSLGATIAATVLYHPESASATTPEGYESTLLALGRWSEMEVSKSMPHGPKVEENEQLWLSLEKTQGMLDIIRRATYGHPAELPAGTRILGIV